jgi:GAF domain-containing protein
MHTDQRKPLDEVAFLNAEAQQFIEGARRLLSQGPGTGATLDQVLADVTAFLGAEAASIFVVEEAGADLVIRYATGEVKQEIVGLRLPSGQGVVGWVVKYHEDLIVPYPGLDARFFEGVDERTGFSTRSILCSPIVLDEQAVGAIEVLNKQQGTFDDDDLVLLRAIARLAAEVLPQPNA